MIPFASPMMARPAAAVPSGFSNVALLMGFEGANGSSSFVDESSFGRTVSNIGTPTITTTSPIMGTSSLDIDTGDGISVPASSDFAFSGAFTVEFFFRPDARLSFRLYDLLFHGGTATGQNSWRLQWWTNSGAGTGQLRYYYSTDGAGLTSLFSSTAGDLALNTTAHLCVERNASNTLRLYKDGVIVGTLAGASGTYFTPTLPLIVGNGPSTDNPSGQFDELRITKGVAVYDGAFSPPSSPFPRS